MLAASTGNHGLAVARAGSLAGVSVTVYVSSSTVPSKMEGIRALGAEPEAGEIVPCKEFDTLSDATAGAIEPGSVTFPICQSVIDARITVSESEIASALRLLAEKEHLMVEGAAVSS